MLPASLRARWDTLDHILVDRPRTKAWSEALFTGTAGVYVPIAETVRSFREVLDGKHDDLPESAFFLKGSIDDVVEAAKGSKKD